MFSTRMMTRPASICWLVGLLILGINCLIPLTPDEAYYWVWSKHLSLSYFDGPPMASYLIYLFTEVLGNSAFVVRLPSVLCFVLAAFMLYRFALKLFDQNTAEKALIIFLFLPFVQMLAHALTPDSPLILFWILTLASFYVAVHEKRNAYFYLAGILTGLLLLSKYMGILLPASFFMYLLFSRENRKQFLNPHLYLAALLAALIFSPVVLWNYEHDWVGFLFQWHHGVAEKKVFSWVLLALFVGGQLAVFSPIFFGLLVDLLFRKSREMWADPKLMYLWWPTVIPLLFFMTNGFFALSQANWSITSYLSGTLLLAYWIEREHYYRIYFYGNVINVIVAMVMIILALMPNTPISIKFHVYPGIMKQAALFIQPGDIVFAHKNTLAAQVMFYSQSLAPVYVFNNQRDVFWSAPISSDKLRHFWYIDNENAADLLRLNNYSRCQKKIDLVDKERLTTAKLSLYECFSS